MESEDHIVPSASRGRRRLRFRAAAGLGLTLAAVAVIVAWLAIGRPSAVTPAPQPARIAVVDAAGTLSTMDDQGGSVAALPVPGVTFQFPAWSPDGSRIAAIGRAGDEGGVYVVDAGQASASPGVTVVYRSADRPPFYLYWTPDGRRLTFLTTEPDGLALRIAPADGSATTSNGAGGAGGIIRQGSPFYWSWVDSGRLLANVGAGRPDAFFGEIGLDGVSLEPTIIAPAPFRAPAITHDGKFRAYLATADDAYGRIVVEARNGPGRNEVSVYGPPAFGFDPAAGSLAFIGQPKGSGGPAPLPVGPLRILDPETGAERALLDGSVVAYFWAPDGGSMAALRLGADDGGGIAAAGRVASAGGRNGATGGPLAEAAGVALQLLFVNVADGTIESERQVRVSDLFVQQLLPFFDQYALSHRLWSPDSTSIVLPIVGDAGADQLVVIPADGSAQRPLAGVMGFWSP